MSKNKKNKKIIIAAAVLVIIIVLVAIKLQVFNTPKIEPTLLPDTYAQKAREKSSGKFNIFADVLTAEQPQCFQDGLRYDDGTIVSCELSGVSFFANRLYFVSDRQIPGYSPIFYCKYRRPLSLKKKKYLNSNNLNIHYKYEDIAISPNLKYLFLLTSFEEKMVNKSAKFNNFIAYMPIYNTSQKFLFPTKKFSAQNVFNFRRQIKKALASKLYPEGPDYFKAEAISIVADSILLMGISRIGESLDNYINTAIILEAEYYIGDNDMVMMIKKLRKTYELFFDEYSGIEHNQYITGMDYDYFNKAIFFTTSYYKGDTPTDVGGYLWRISFADYQLNRKPDLVYLATSRPLLFAHKPSGVTVIDEETVFVICDDERIKGSPKIFDKRREFNRQLNQTAYYVLKIYK